MKAMEGIEYGRLWIEIMANDNPGCDWGFYSVHQNCQFVKDSIHELEKLGVKKMGVLTDDYDWNYFMEYTPDCNDLADNYPLWY